MLLWGRGTASLWNQAPQINNATRKQNTRKSNSNISSNNQLSQMKTNRNAIQHRYYNYLNHRLCAVVRRQLL